MPYVIVKSKQGNVDGFRVRKQHRDEHGKFHYFSSHPLSYEVAKKQLVALHIADARRSK